MPTQERFRNQPASPASPLFDEQRAVPWWWWLVAFVIIVPTVEAIVVLGPEMTTQAGWLAGGITLAITVAAITFALIALSSVGVTVRPEGLLAGKTLLPTSAIGQIRSLDAVTARQVLGQQARADAHLSIRPWIKTAIQIEVVDSVDTTPYWVVATRRPAELIGVLHTLRSVNLGDAALPTGSMNVAEPMTMNRAEQ